MKILVFVLLASLATLSAQYKATKKQCIIQSKIVERIAEFRDIKVRIFLTKMALPKPWWNMAEEVYKNTNISPTKYKQIALLRCLDAYMA